MTKQTRRRNLRKQVWNDHDDQDGPPRPDFPWLWWMPVIFILMWALFISVGYGIDKLLTWIWS